MKITRLVIAAAAVCFAAGAVADETRTQAQATEHDPQVLRQVQEQLSAKGHDAGAADGQWGPQTERALKDFQEAQGIEPSGELDERTLSALGVEGAAAGATAGEGGAAAGETSGAPSGESEPARSN